MDRRQRPRASGWFPGWPALLRAARGSWVDVVATVFLGVLAGLLVWAFPLAVADSWDLTSHR